MYDVLKVLKLVEPMNKAVITAHGKAIPANVENVEHGEYCKGQSPKGGSLFLKIFWFYIVKHNAHMNASSLKML